MFRGARSSFEAVIGHIGGHGGVASRTNNVNSSSSNIIRPPGFTLISYQGPVYPPLPPQRFRPCLRLCRVAYYQGSNGSGANWPSSSRGNSLVQRQVHYTPTSSPTNSSGRHGRGRRSHSHSDDMNLLYTENLAQNRKEATRIKAAAMNCAKLKDLLPISNQKSSKMSLLDRGVDLRRRNYPGLSTPLMATIVHEKKLFTV
ncbi:hypothetical protein B0H17DRAFT_1200772 [Mycena rosella]|uniref:BHLH domain-containing protein n=1 Tax=Mycena rosella TaxID=1033263 RepID=A0AAD7GF10_MYCRO|nr:hypothetical protein B0H17DRAFT_1200772 [Mycena rosella]